MLAGVALSFAAAFLAAAVTRRAIAVAFSAAVWPIYMSGLSAGLWGHGLGDGWQYSAAALTAACALGAFAGLVLARRVAGTVP